MRNLFQRWTSVINGAVLVTSCHDDVEIADMDELSAYAKNYVSMRLGAAQSRNSMALGMTPGNPANESFQRLYSNFNGLSNGGRIAGDSTDSSEPGSPKDSTIIDYPWQSCAVITTVKNNDGSVNTTYDYGDGCWEGDQWYKYLMFGKYVSTYKSEMSQEGTRFFDTYSYSSTYDNYGGMYYFDTIPHDWVYNGSSTYKGSSEYDTAKQTYKGGYEYSDATTSRYDQSSNTYKGNGKSYYDEKRTVQERNDYEYKTGNDFYRTKVLKPLVSNYDCNPYMNEGIALKCWCITYVSGCERIEFRQGEESGLFEIDYGDGECDRIITIIENGKRVEIDLGYDIIITQ